jgi:hypothetical protein
MIDRIERMAEYEVHDRNGEGWSGVVSAWALVVLFLVLLAGVSALALTRGGAPPARHLAGAVIPRHDPCEAPGVPSAPGVDGCKSIRPGQDWSDYYNYW